MAPRTNNTFIEALESFGAKTMADVEKLGYLPDADDDVINMLKEAVSTITQTFMRNAYNTANGQGGGVPAQSPQPSAPSMAGMGTPGLSQGYGSIGMPQVSAGGGELSRAVQ